MYVMWKVCEISGRGRGEGRAVLRSGLNVDSLCEILQVAHSPKDHSFLMCNDSHPSGDPSWCYEDLIHFLPYSLTQQTHELRGSKRGCQTDLNTSSPAPMKIRDGQCLPKLEAKGSWFNANNVITVDIE